MATPGFTAEAALGRSHRGYRRPFRAGRSDTHLLAPQQGNFSDCSDDGHLCYDCFDDGVGCFCDWYWDDHFVVSSDCGTD